LFADREEPIKLTPLAAKIFRMGDEKTQRALVGSQFLECSELTSMALEMRAADPEDSGFSLNARLPAPFTFIEASIRGQRVAFACQEKEGDARVFVNSVAERHDGRIDVPWQAAFFPGSDQVSLGEESMPDQRRLGGIWAGLMLVEKFLCIINQPGLTHTRERKTDKRVLRLAAEQGIALPQPKWHECHIRPGVHGGATTSPRPEHREHQLRYVRRHLKPSLGSDRWIDGYWRGNADLGIHYKNYIAHVPTHASDAVVGPTTE
jgi:hypothetical protein